MLLVASIVTLVILAAWGERQYRHDAYEQRRDIIRKTFPDMPPDAVEFCARHLDNIETARAVWVQYGHLKID